MAIPLSPESGLFPDTYVAPFIVAPEVGDLADDVAASFYEFRAIEDAVREGLRIRAVFETKAFDPLKEELKPHTIAKVTKASPLWRVLGETEIVIQFRQWFWEKFTEAERRGVLHHELSHIEIGEPGPDGIAKVSLREHDVEEFALTVKRFGPRRDHHAAFFRAFLDWHDRQDRVVDVAALSTAALERAVDEINAGALDDPKTGTRVRAARPGEPLPADDTDLRPTGEVNADELRGEVERASGFDKTAAADRVARKRASRRNGSQHLTPLN